jgi:hypothetical protein
MPKTTKKAELNLPEKKSTEKVKNKTIKDKKILNLGETYGDESFQITTEKVKNSNKKEVAHNEIEEELQKLPINHRHGKFSFNDYLVFFAILLLGIVIGTVMALGEVKNSNFKFNFSRSNTSQDLVSNGNVSPSSPYRTYPSAAQSYTNPAGYNTNNSPAPTNQNITSTNNNSGIKEFNNGNYKVYQKADGTLIIAW